MSETLKTFICSYRMNDGSEWGFEIKAASHADAEARLARIRGNGSVDGEVALKVPVPNWFQRLFRPA